MNYLCLDCNKEFYALSSNQRCPYCDGWRWLERRTDIDSCLQCSIADEGCSTGCAEFQKVSEICRTKNIQDCSHCDDLSCGDNTTQQAEILLKRDIPACYCYEGER